MKFKIKATVIITLLLMITVVFSSCENVSLGDIGNMLLSKPQEGECEFHFIDVGQGDSSLIVSGDKAVLIDAGPSSSKDTLCAYIAQRTKTIDYFIMTHPHEDHIGGAADILEYFTVKNVIMPNADYDSATYDKVLSALESNTEINVIEAVPGDVHTLDKLSIKILAPNSDDYTSTNNYSVVANISYGSVSVMYTGDAELDSEYEILDSFSPSELSADVLKVGHHGSVTSTSSRFLSAVSPEIAVISCGEGNSYGHPHAEILDDFSSADITVYRTDLDGSVVLASDGEKISLK